MYQHFAQIHLSIINSNTRFTIIVKQDVFPKTVHRNVGTKHVLGSRSLSDNANTQ